jgi:hypothetical protein
MMLLSRRRPDRIVRVSRERVQTSRSSSCGERKRGLASA